MAHDTPKKNQNIYSGRKITEYFFLKSREEEKKSFYLKIFLKEKEEK